VSGVEAEGSDEERPAARFQLAAEAADELRPPGL
jgi:hypothetical protein